MNKTNYYFLILLLCFIAMATSCRQSPKLPTELSILQMNIWHEGREVEGGFEAIINEIERINPDVALFSEVRNPNGRIFIPTIITELEKRGLKYYGESPKSTDVAVISKYPVKEQTIIYYEETTAPVLKAQLQFDEKKIITVYSAHLDYKNYACYLPRGYSGSTWKKIDAPIVNEDSVLTANRLSVRAEAIKGVLRDVKENSSEDQIIILGGDFNEPSHLDWQAGTKDLYDHNGAIINWDCSVLLTEYGFKDTFREMYPSPVTHPGFTFPSDNKDVEISKLTWAPESDERDRIDFIYYLPNKNITLDKIVIVGPEETILKSRRMAKDSQDEFSIPKGVWPTDHKALFATFKIK